MGSSWIVPLALGLIGGGGIAGAIVALLKVRPEAGQIVVTAAQGAVVVQSGVIDDLNEELGRQVTRCKNLEERLTRALDRIEDLETVERRIQELERKLAEVQQELDTTLAERDKLAREKQELEFRVRELETKVAELKSATPGVE